MSHRGHQSLCVCVWVGGKTVGNIGTEPKRGKHCSIRRDGRKWAGKQLPPLAAKPPETEDFGWFTTRMPWKLPGYMEGRDKQHSISFTAWLCHLSDSWTIKFHKVAHISVSLSLFLPASSSNYSPLPNIALSLLSLWKRWVNWRDWL